MSATAKTLVIQADGTFEVRDVPTGYPAFNKAVLDGGSMECVYVVHNDEQVVFTLDEEGGPWIKNLPVNETASRLLSLIAGREGVLNGPVAVNGFEYDTVTGVPDSVVALMDRVTGG